MAIDLALDLSTTTGWALGDTSHAQPVRKYGRWLLERRPTLIPRDLQIGYRMSCLCGELDRAITVHQPDRVVFEAPLHRADHTSRLLICLAGAVEMVCDERKVMCEEGHLSQVRALVLPKATHKGQPMKSRVLSWARENGWSPEDDNVADALVLLRYCQILRGARVTA